jgi:hypothetical protein
MKRLWALGIFLTACVAAPQPVPEARVECTKKNARHRAQDDAFKSGAFDFAFLSLCPENSRDPLRAAYRDSFQRVRERGSAALTLEPSISLRSPAASEPSWVCEVEGEHRVFTGVGVSRAEASSSARSTCGAHFSANACGPSDCSRGL